MISVTSLSKVFGEFRAVDDISFTVQPGEVLGFLGPNGAGKSTTMKMLTGFLEPSAGTINVLGHDIRQSPKSAQSQIGYLPEGAPSYADMTVSDSLKFVAKVRGFSGAEAREKIAAVVKQVELEKVLGKRIETLSKGFRRRLGLAQAIMHDPKVLILDEPTDGLDPNQKHQVRELIRNLAKDKIVIVSTHILEEVSAVCTRAMILTEGKVIFDGSPSELAAKSEQHNAVSVHLADAIPSLHSELEKLESVSSVANDDDKSFKVFPVDGVSILSDVNDVLHRMNARIDELHVESGRLDDVFRTLTTGEVSA